MKGHLLRVTALGLLAAAPPVHAHVTRVVIDSRQTKAERIKNNNPRPSLEERYGTHDAFVARVRSAVADLVAQRHLLPADARAIVTAAESSEVLK